MNLYECKNWDDVSFNMQQLAESRLEKAVSEAEEETKINSVKKEYQFKNEMFKERIKNIETEIEAYTKANLKDFGDKRSKKFPFGKISLTNSKQVFITSLEITLNKIKELGLNECWKSKDEVNKNNLKALDLKTLAKIGATIIDEDNIKIETLSKK